MGAFAQSNRAAPATMNLTPEKSERIAKSISVPFSVQWVKTCLIAGKADPHNTAQIMIHPTIRGNPGEGSLGNP